MRQSHVSIITRTRIELRTTCVKTKRYLVSVKQQIVIMKIVLVKTIVSQYFNVFQCSAVKPKVSISRSMHVGVEGGGGKVQLARTSDGVFIQTFCPAPQRRKPYRSNKANMILYQLSYY